MALFMAPARVEKIYLALDLLKREYFNTFDYVVILCPILQYNAMYHQQKWFQIDPNIIWIVLGDTVTQPKILAILGLHVVIMVFGHDDLAQISDGLPEIDGFVHKVMYLFHLVAHQVLTEDNSQLEVWLHHLLKLCLLIGNELDVSVLPDVLHDLSEH